MDYVCLIIIWKNANLFLLVRRKRIVCSYFLNSSIFVVKRDKCLSLKKEGKKKDLLWYFYDTSKSLLGNQLPFECVVTICLVICLSEKEGRWWNKIPGSGFATVIHLVHQDRSIACCNQYISFFFKKKSGKPDT